MSKAPSRLQLFESSAEESSRAVREQLQKSQDALAAGVDRLKAKALAMMNGGRRRSTVDDLPASALKRGR